MNNCTDYWDIGEDTWNVTTERRTRITHCHTHKQTHKHAHAQSKVKDNTNDEQSIKISVTIFIIRHDLFYLEEMRSYRNKREHKVINSVVFYARNRMIW